MTFSALSNLIRFQWLIKPYTVEKEEMHNTIGPLYPPVVLLNCPCQGLAKLAEFHFVLPPGLLGHTPSD